MARPNKPRTLAAQANVSARVARELKQRGWSPADLAAKVTGVGCPIQTSAVYRIVDGQRKIDVDELAALAQVFEVEVQELLLDPELVDRQRVAELIREVTHHQQRLWDHTAEAMSCFVEIFRMAHEDPDLYEYLENQRKAVEGPYAEAFSGLFFEIPGYDETEPRGFFASYLAEIVRKSERVAQRAEGIE